MKTSEQLKAEGLKQMKEGFRILKFVVMTIVVLFVLLVLAAVFQQAKAADYDVKALKPLAVTHIAEVEQAMDDVMNVMMGLTQAEHHLVSRRLNTLQNNGKPFTGFMNPFSACYMSGANLSNVWQYYMAQEKDMLEMSYKDQVDNARLCKEAIANN